MLERIPYDKKILIISIIISIVVASISGILGFVISTKQEKITSERFLQESLQGRLDALQTAVKSSTMEMDFIKQPHAIENLFLKEESNDTPLVRTLLTTTFSAIKIVDSNNKVIYSQGELTDKPVSTIVLQPQPYPTELVWSNGINIRMTAFTTDNEKHRKKIILEWPLTKLFKTVKSDHNKIMREYYVCTLNENSQLNCLSDDPSLKNTLSNQAENKIRYSISENKSLGLYDDYKNDSRYVVSYLPYSQNNIGLLIKVDLSNVYLSILARVLFGAMVVLLAVASGSALFYLMVLPLVKKVKNSESQFRSMFDSSAVGMAMVSLDEKWLAINSSLCAILGYTQDELTKTPMNEVIYKEDREDIAKMIHDAVNGYANNFRVEKRFIHKSHHHIWGLLNATLIYDESMQPSHFIIQLQDITKQKEYEEKLNFQARHDALTGLANRSLLEEKLNHVINQAQRSQASFAVFFLDLDKFKDINDRLGHDAGDRLLKIIADRLKGSVRKHDVVARLGGDEFVLVLTDLHEYKAAALFAERLINIILTPTRIKGQEIFTTSSIGISFYPTDGLDSSTLIKNADHALYLAKDSGRNNYQFCEASVSSEIRDRMSFELDLKNAIDNEEFKMYYLPQIDPTYQSVVGVEGLLRWQSKQYGLVTPQNILPIAEETGLIIPLSEWVIKTTCEHVKQWQETMFKQLHLSVNISARHYMHEHMIESIVETLKAVNFDPRYLMLEINENLIMQDPVKSMELISSLKRYGIKIIIDNFGTGYSSFTYLQDFNVDSIKIDKSLVQQCATNQKRNELIIAIIKFANDLGINVIAEGVETEEQFNFLINAGCNELQGYYISKPLLASELSSYLASKKEVLPTQ